MSTETWVVLLMVLGVIALAALTAYFLGRWMRRHDIGSWN